jgi:rhomboid protease GluP
MFLHVGWIHLLWNTYASIGWCTAIERAMGKRRFLFLYLASGVGAGCVSLVGSMIFGPKVSAGASGAMFGIIGATLAIRRQRLTARASRD